MFAHLHSLLERISAFGRDWNNVQTSCGHTTSLVHAVARKQPRVLWTVGVTTALAGECCTAAERIREQGYMWRWHKTRHNVVPGYYCLAELMKKRHTNRKHTKSNTRQGSKPFRAASMSAEWKRPCDNFLPSRVSFGLWHSKKKIVRLHCDYSASNTIK